MMEIVDNIRPIYGSGYSSVSPMDLHIWKLNRPPPV